MNDTKVHDNDAIICGRVAEIGPVALYGVNGKSKRVVVLETASKWPQTIPTEFHGKAQDLVAELAVDDVVQVLCHVNGRRWNDKVFLTLFAYDVNLLAHGKQMQAQAAAPKQDTPAAPAVPPASQDTPQEDDQLPF